MLQSNFLFLFRFLVSLCLRFIFIVFVHFIHRAASPLPAKSSPPSPAVINNSPCPVNIFICTGLYCIVVGYWRLMPPDALQPKTYCTNPGLQSFLLAPPGVSTRDPSSERRNYLGEKWPMNFA